MPLFIDHGIQQGALVGIGVRMSGASLPEILVAGGIAGVVNTIPDVDPFIAGLLRPNDPRVTWKRFLGINWPYRNDRYRKYHDGKHPWWVRWLWEFHLVVDELFHKEGEDWWPREWKRMLRWWLAEILLVLLCFI